MDIYRKQWSDLLEREDLLTWVKNFTAGLRLPETTTAADLLDEVARDSGLSPGARHRPLRLLTPDLAGVLCRRRATIDLGPDAGAALLGEHLPDARWQEVIALYSDLADHAGPLLQRILGQTETRGKVAWLQAGRCLAEGAKDVPAKICRQAADGLLTLLRQVEAGDADALTADESAQVAGLAGRVRGRRTARLRAHLTRDSHSQRRLPGGASSGQAARRTSEPGLQAEVSRRIADLARSDDMNEKHLAGVAWARSLAWSRNHAETLLVQSE